VKPEAIKVTVVIPTYERRAQLLRCLLYWAEYPVNLIIMDGSTLPTLQEVDVNRLDRVTYVHLPKSFEDRLCIGAAMVRTPYAMFLSDDEFILNSGLISACEVMDFDPEVSAVLGRTLIFATFKGNMLADFYYESASNLNINSASPLERFRERLQVPENVIFYSLTRTNTLQLAGKFIAERKYSCPYVSEHQVEAIFCAAGKVVVLPRVFWLRNLDTPPVSITGWDRLVKFKNWIVDASHSDEISYLLQSADRHLAVANSDVQNITGEEFLSELKKIALRSRNNHLSFLYKVKLMFNRGFKFLPGWIRNFVRGLRRSIRSHPPKGLKPIYQLIKEIEGQMSIDINDLLRIKKVVEGRDDQSTTSARNVR